MTLGSANLTAIIVAIIGASAGALSYVQAAAARRQDRRTAASAREGEAFDRARKIDAGIVTRLEAELERISRLLEDSRSEAETLRGHVRALTVELVRLERVLITAGLDVSREDAAEGDEVTLETMSEGYRRDDEQADRAEESST